MLDRIFGKDKNKQWLAGKEIPFHSKIYCSHYSQLLYRQYFIDTESLSILDKSLGDWKCTDSHGFLLVLLCCFPTPSILAPPRPLIIHNYILFSKTRQKKNRLFDNFQIFQVKWKINLYAVEFCSRFGFGLFEGGRVEGQEEWLKQTFFVTGLQDQSQTWLSWISLL